MGELLRNGSEGRAAAELLSDAVGTTLALIHRIGTIDRHENLRDAGLGLADVRPHAAKRVVDFRLGHIHLGANLPPDDRAPGDLRLDLLRRDIGGDAHALEILLELALRQAGSAFDLGVAARNLGVRRFDAQFLGILNLQPLVDHLPQHLRRHALAQIRTVLQARRADREQHPLRQVEVGNGVVVDAGHDAQALAGRGLGCRALCRRPLGGRSGGQQHDREDDEGAEEGREHFTGGA